MVRPTDDHVTCTDSFSGFFDLDFESHPGCESSDRRGNLMRSKVILRWSLKTSSHPTHPNSTVLATPLLVAGIDQQHRSGPSTLSSTFWILPTFTLFLGRKGKEKKPLLVIF
jgi:hypothetical protein